MTPLNEDTLVQQTTAEYLRDALSWETVYAFNTETFGSEGTLGRLSDREIVLTRPLRQKLRQLNPDLPEAAYDDAIRQLTETSAAQSPIAVNREKYHLLRDGVRVTYREEEGQIQKPRLQVFDFKNPENNDFLAVRELWIRGPLYRRRADVIGFVNGIPLLFIELKNVDKDIRRAYDENLADYREVVPHLFHHNALAILANGEDARMGSVFSRFEHFLEWKRLAEDEPGIVDMETLLKGVCQKRNFLDLFESFILFDDSSEKTAKIVGRNHQFLGVNRAVQSVLERRERDGKLGVYWHTQGAGKSYSMVFFTRKVHRKLGAGFTFLVTTDRTDLDNQIYKTFAGCGVVDHDKEPCRAKSAEHLKQLLGEHKSHVFTLVHKFNQDVDHEGGYTQRDDVIVISDEAHRSQYGRLALNLRNALPNASYIGFTGTPLFKDDQITRRVFGDYISTYDFQRAVGDGATVPLYYDARGDKLGVATDEINERVAEKIEELEADDVDVQQRLEKELKREYHVITAERRLDQIARDFVEHYSNAWETGKAMLICIDKITCVRMYELVRKYWDERMRELDREIRVADDEQELVYKERQHKWMDQTKIAVVISEEQGEVEKFRQWGLDVTPHRRLIKSGFELENGKSLDLDSAFKKEEHPFRVAIVCAMWLTGFDVPSLATLYLDKPLKAHTLMQAIARANRVNEGKNNGLVVDYCGILCNLRRALAIFAGRADAGHGAEGDLEIDPVKPEEELLADLEEAINMVRVFLAEREASLEEIVEQTGFPRIKAIGNAKEAANQNDETRKRFEILCREVFRKFRACINLKTVNAYRDGYAAIDVVYKKLQEDRDHADISDILRQLHQIVDEAIDLRDDEVAERQLFDISRIDFKRLRAEFERHDTPCTAVQNLRQAVENRLRRLLAQNPTRMDLQRHYEELVARYNREKDSLIIEETFAALLELVQEIGEEESRHLREGLDSEEYLAVYDLLKKPSLDAAEIRRVKKAAVELLDTLKREKLQIDHWTEKESTRDAVRLEIRDFLWSDDTGLPVGSYSEKDVGTKAAEVFGHVFRAYPTLPSPVYAADAVSPRA